MSNFIFAMFLMMMASIGFAAPKSEQFTTELASALQTSRNVGCQGKTGRSALTLHPLLSTAATNINQGHELKTALSDAGYRSVSTQVIKLGGYRSLTAIRSVFTSKYCDLLLDVSFSEFGVGGSLGSAVVILAKPFVRKIDDPRSVVLRVVELVNLARATGGVCGGESFSASSPMNESLKLTASAQAHATDMAVQNYYSHQSKDGRSASERIRTSGYQTNITAENIAAGQQTAEEVVAGWLKSPGHCRNIHNPRLIEIGVGVALEYKSDKGIYWVQNFGGGER